MASGYGEITVCIPTEAFHELLVRFFSPLEGAQYSMGLPYVTDDCIEVNVAFDTAGETHPEEWPKKPRAAVESRLRLEIYNAIKALVDEAMSKTK